MGGAPGGSSSGGDDPKTLLLSLNHPTEFVEKFRRGAFGQGATDFSSIFRVAKEATSGDMTFTEEVMDQLAEVLHRSWHTDQPSTPRRRTRSSSSGGAANTGSWGSWERGWGWCTSRTDPMCVDGCPSSSPREGEWTVVASPPQSTAVPEGPMDTHPNYLASLLGEGSDDESLSLQQEEGVSVTSASAPPATGTPSRCFECMPPSELLATWACALPILHNAIPKDHRGDCVIPHHHRMTKVTMDSCQLREHQGRVVCMTFKVCDRCMESINEPQWYHCSRDCDVDFCCRCHDQLQSVLDSFFADQSKEHSQGLKASASEGVATAAIASSSSSVSTAETAEVAATAAEHCMKKMLWTIHLTDLVAHQVLASKPAAREELAKNLVSEWPVELFQTLVSSVVNVCNSKLLYNETRGAISTSVKPSGDGFFEQETRSVYSDKSFWLTVELLQFLRECNECPLNLCCTSLEEGQRRGPRIESAHFILEGINKCKPAVEWRQWRRICQDDTEEEEEVSLIFAPLLRTGKHRRTFIAHNSLLPIDFRRQCVITDLCSQVFEDRKRKIRGLIKLSVNRDAKSLVGGFTQTVCHERDYVPEPDENGETPPVSKWKLRKELSVVFGGEPGSGQGVRREFFAVAFRAFLQELFSSESSGRTFWFGDEDRPDNFYAFGVLLGLAIIHDVLMPAAFPRAMYDLMLKHMGSPRSQCLQDGASPMALFEDVSPSEASSLLKVLEYTGEDIEEHFGMLGWERVGPQLEGKRLSQATKAEFVQAYIDWSLGSRIDHQIRPLAAGLEAVVGGSVILQRMVDAEQLEQILCGGEVPVDIEAIRHRAFLECWDASDAEFLNAFWEVLKGLDEEVKRQFVVFVTSSDREPLKGWGELKITVQKNGMSDERLPSAYTCYSLLLLPRYSSVEVLKQRLAQALRNGVGFGLQ